jgi:hypothetical protein
MGMAAHGTRARSLSSITPPATADVDVAQPAKGGTMLETPVALDVHTRALSRGRRAMHKCV